MFIDFVPAHVYHKLVAFLILNARVDTQLFPWSQDTDCNTVNHKKYMVKQYMIVIIAFIDLKMIVRLH